jgi:hypothetical protein
VASGVYYIRVEYVDNFGNATTYVKQVQVLSPQVSGAGVAIFNSAGEIVWEGPLPGGNAASGALSLNESVVVQELDSATGNLVKPLVITVGTGSEDWNGKNMEGANVAPGSYSVQVASSQPGSDMVVETKQFEVLASTKGLPSADVLIVPNPWHGDQPLALYYTPSLGDYGSATLYTLAGGRVAMAVDPANSGKLQFNKLSLAAGVYLVDFRQMQGSTILVRKVSKLAIIE